MPGISPYERMQIESLLQRDPPAEVMQGLALVLLPDSVEALLLHDTILLPALRQCGLNTGGIVRVFNSDSHLRTITREVLSAEVIVADVSMQGSHMLYVLGLCHALGRCPIMLARNASTLPFNLASLRFVEYTDTPEGLLRLRDSLVRAVRVFLAASRTSAQAGGFDST